MTSPNRSFVAELDCCTDDVVITLKKYEDINNEINKADNDLLYEENVLHDVDIVDPNPNQSRLQCFVKLPSRI